MNNTTATQVIEVGSRVCRKAARSKVVGTVVKMFGTKAHVDWDKCLTGTTRLGSGRGHDSVVRLDSLVHEVDFVPRKLSGPVESDWHTVAYTVECDHPSHFLVSEHGVNWFVFSGDSKEAAEVKYQELEAEGTKGLRMARQDKARWIPVGCRNFREKTRWETIR
jgi:hypothetical protein